MKCMVSAFIISMAVSVMTSGFTAAPVHAATDTTCVVYVNLINKTLMHRLRLNNRQRDQIKALRQQGLDSMAEGVTCRAPLRQALKLLGIKAPNFDSRGKSRRVHRLGSR
jgi:hypothetical protein